MSSPRIRSLRPLAALAAAAALLLSGCGSAQPGVAVRVGEETVSMARVDELTPLFCKAIEPSLKSADPNQSRSVYAMSEIRAYVARQLAARSVAEQIAAEYDVKPGTTYTAALAQQRDLAQTYPEDTREAFVDINSIGAYVQDVVGAAATAELADAGVASPTQEEISAKASDLFSQWPDTHGLDIDPRLGFSDLQGSLDSVDQSVSFPLSGVATAGDKPRWLSENALLADGDPDKLTGDAQATAIGDFESYVRSLPDSQRCG